MKTFNNWLLCVLCVGCVAAIGFFSRTDGLAWHSFAYPIPIKRQNFYEIYLADFAYLSFLSVTLYWTLIHKFGSRPPRIGNLSGVFLALAAGIFTAVALDFLVNFLPQMQECVSTSLGNGITIERCEDRVRTWAATAAAMTLIASAAASVLNVRNSDPDETQAFE